jgi:hypothetical protein
LFPTLKEFLGGRNFKSDEEVKDAINEWLNGLASEVYDKGTQKLIAHYDKCPNVSGDYVQKELRVCNNDTVNFVKFLFCLFFFTAKWSLLSG